MRPLRLLAAALVLSILLPAVVAASPRVTVTMDKPRYGPLDAAGDGATGSVLVLDAEGRPVADVPVRVVVLHRAPFAGYLRSETLSAVTDDAGVATFRPSAAFLAPGDYVVGAWATLEGVEHVGQATYSVGP